GRSLVAGMEYGRVAAAVEDVAFAVGHCGGLEGTQESWHAAVAVDAAVDVADVEVAVEVAVEVGADAVAVELQLVHHCCCCRQPTGTLVIAFWSQYLFFQLFLGLSL
ncbi:hypothetical protein WICPIJ_009036, partial [Wickerhamomyces pijperi]